jgi:hypothetical protein
VEIKGKGSGALLAGVAPSYSGEVDQPWRLVMSKKRTCLSDDPERTIEGLKSMDAILHMR